MAAWVWAPEGPAENVGREPCEQPDAAAMPGGIRLRRDPPPRATGNHDVGEPEVAVHEAVRLRLKVRQ